MWERSKEEGVTAQQEIGHRIVYAQWRYRQVSGPEVNGRWSRVLGQDARDYSGERRGFRLKTGCLNMRRDA